MGVDPIPRCGDPDFADEAGAMDPGQQAAESDDASHFLHVLLALECDRVAQHCDEVDLSAGPRGSHLNSVHSMEVARAGSLHPSARLIAAFVCGAAHSSVPFQINLAHHRPRSLAQN